MKKAEQSNLDIFDYAKYLLSFAVVLLHSYAWPNIAHPWVRIAVPLFFLISSYLFFTKLNGLPQSQHPNAILKYVRRNLILYAVWSVLLLPFWISDAEKCFSGGVFVGILRLLRLLFVNGAFRASWFILACATAVPLVYILSKKLSPRLLFALSLALYIACCLVTNYGRLIQESVLMYINRKIFGGMYLSFISAMVWVFLGRYFSQTPPVLSKKKIRWGMGISAALLLGEELVIRALNSRVIEDCYFMLIPFCFFIFAWLLTLRGDRYKIKNAAELRHQSTVIYVVHLTLMDCVFIRLFPALSRPLLFVLTAACAWLLSFVLVRLARIKRLKRLHWL